MAERAERSRPPSSRHPSRPPWRSSAAGVMHSTAQRQRHVGQCEHAHVPPAAAARSMSRSPDCFAPYSQRGISRSAGTVRQSQDGARRPECCRPVPPLPLQPAVTAANRNTRCQCWPSSVELLVDEQLQYAHDAFDRSDERERRGKPPALIICNAVSPVHSFQCMRLLDFQTRSVHG